MSTKHDRMFHHQHAHHLDSEERRAWLAPADVIDHLGLVPGMHIADIGAGTGYFAIPMSERIAPDGRVSAVDLQAEMLTFLQQKLQPGSRIVAVQGSAEETGLPGLSQQLVFFASVWHEIDDRAKALAEAERLLQSGGRVAIVDWRAECASPPGPPVEHRLAGTAVADELRETGWTDVTLRNVGSYAYLVMASKPLRCC